MQTLRLHDLKCILYVVFLITVKYTVAQNGNSNKTAESTTTALTPTSPHSTTTTPSVPTTSTSFQSTTNAPSTDELCAQNNGSCSDCLGVSGTKCLWCYSDNTCQAYPVSKVLPPKDMCPLDKARWGVCWLNFEALIIAVSTLGGIIILTITCCCVYCCCCRKRCKRKYEKEDARYNAQKMERKSQNDERRAERKERLDEIRRKYGLMKDEPYQRFDP